MITKNETKKKRKLRAIGFNDVMVQCHSVNGQSTFITDEDLKKYHEMYVKLNKLYSDDKIIYYISERELDNAVNDKKKVKCTLK